MPYTILRSDYGTENATLATIHVTFRLQHSDSFAGEKSFMYGSSESNIVSHLKRVIFLSEKFLILFFLKSSI